MVIGGKKYVPYTVAQQMAGVGRSKLQGLVRNGVIEAYQPGKKALLSVQDIEAWIESTKIKSRRPVGRPRNGARR